MTDPLPRQETRERPPVAIYLELCRMDTAGLTHTDEYRALNREYREAIDREIAAGKVI